MPTNIAQRYSQVSPLNTSVTTEDRLIIAQPITPGGTDYVVVNIEISDFYQHVRTKIQEEGISLIAEIGDGLTGTGSEEDPFGLDEEWFDSLSVRKDRLDLTIVGDRSFPELPISGSYFSASYPYDPNKQMTTAFLESNGDLRILNPVTNGEVVRYTYSTIPNWLVTKETGSPTAGLVNSDTVYQPPELTSDEYVSHMFPASSTAMIVEITNSVTGIVEHAFVKLNGSFVYTRHTVIRLGDGLIESTDFATTTTTKIRSLRTRPPVACVFKGKNYIFSPTHKATSNGIDIFCYEVSELGSLTPVTNWEMTTPIMSSINTNMRLCDVAMTMDTNVANAELYLNEGCSLTTNNTAATTTSPYNQIALALAQTKDKLRLLIIRNESFTYTVGGTVTFFYTNSWPLEITFGDTNKAIAPDHIAPGPLSGVASLSGVVWSGPHHRMNGQYASTSQTYYTTVMADGSMLLSRPASSNNTIAINYVRRNITPNTTGYDLVDMRIYYPTEVAGMNGVRGVMPAITSLVGRATVNYLSSGNAPVGGYAGSLWSMNSSFASESKPFTESDIVGPYSKTDTLRWTLLDGNTYSGFEMNNTRVQRPSVAKTIIISYQNANGVPSHGNFWWRRQFTSTDNVSGGTVSHLETNEWIVDSRRNVLKTLVIDPAVKTALENQLLAIFTDTLAFNITALPDPNDKKLVIMARGLKPGDGGHWCRYGLFDYTSTDNGNERTITAVDFNPDNLTSNLHVSSNAFRHHYLTTQFRLSGIAVQKNVDGTYHYVVKEGATTQQANLAGSGTAGSYYCTHDNVSGVNTYIRAHNASDGSSAVMFPTIGPYGTGLGSIDATMGGGTFYVFKPILEASPDLTPNQQGGIVLAAMQPSKIFSVLIGSEIHVVLDGIETRIMPQVYDLTTFTPTPANRTFYFYLVSNGVDVNVVVSLTKLSESFTRTLFAVVTTGAETVENIVAKPFTRLGLYRISQTPIGTAVPATVGSAALYPINYWLTNFYQT